MTTHFISAEIDLSQNPLLIQKAIESELASRGEPLRWAITKVDSEKETMQVEAIILVNEANQL